jgi:hypothetical protein
MRAFRVFEAVAGVLASVSGLGALVYLLVGPAYSTQSCQANEPGQPATCTSGTATLLQVNGVGALVPLGIFAVLLVGVGAAAVVHSRTDAPLARVTLWVATGILTIFAVVTGFSIGEFFLPSVGLALVSCLASIRRGQIAHA